MQFLAWGGFLVMIGFFLALDLGVFNKEDHVVTGKSALKWTGVWATTALLFSGFVYYAYENQIIGLGAGGGGGRGPWADFLTGYIVEMSLSLDNIFVIALVFKFFKVPVELQHRVLFWGILGAIVLRITMILLGAALIQAFSFTIYIFGAFLVFTAIKMALSKGDEDFDPNDSFIVKTARKLMPISPKLEGSHFFTYVDGKRAMTPLFLVLLVVEGTDVVFAVDSIPAIFGVTTDPFIVFTSNIFAIMGLRSLYFALASLLREFAYLKYSLIAVLMFVGVKMLASGVVHLSSLVSLGIIGGLLAAGVAASLLMKTDDEDDPPLSVVADSLPNPTEPEGGAPKGDAVVGSATPGAAGNEAASE